MSVTNWQTQIHDRCSRHGRRLARTNGTTLHLLCGKIAAGKSTLTAQLAKTPGTVVVSEDDWLARLYPGDMVSVADYVRCSARFKDAMTPHPVALLKSGV